MYKFIFIITVLVISAPVFAQRVIQTQEPFWNPNYIPQSAYYGGYYNPRSRYVRNYGSRFADINDLERYATGKNFFRESDITRIERMELIAFGAVQEGDINSRYANVRNAILSRPKQNNKTSLLKSIGNYFTGQMTGFTPSVDSYSNSGLFPFADDTNFGKSSYSDYSSPWGSGQQYNNYGTGSTTGIHILD
jgi:hypothetical protein